MRSKKSSINQVKEKNRLAECFAKLDAIPMDVGGAREIDRLPSHCDKNQEFVLKRDNKRKKVAVIEAAVQARKYSGMIEKYKKIVPAPAGLLSSDIVIQWGASNFGPLIEFIDLVQNNSQSKTKYEMVEKSLVMRHRITDPVTGKSSTMVYVFTPFPELAPGEVLLTRIIAEKSSLGGLVKEQEEVDVKEIGMFFAIVYVGMKSR